MAGDHGKIHVISNTASFDAKLAEAESTGKIVSIMVTIFVVCFLHFCKSSLFWTRFLWFVMPWKQVFLRFVKPYADNSIIP